MKHILHILFFASTLSSISFSLAAQDDNDYTDNRRDKKRDENAINTKQETPLKIIEHIVGRWQVSEIYQGSQNVTGTSENADRVIEFGRENRYVIHSGNEQIDSGLYRLNENHAIVYLESQSGEEPQEWNVSFRNDMMTLQQGNRTAAQDNRIRYVYIRISPASRRPD